MVCRSVDENNSASTRQHITDNTSPHALQEIGQVHGARVEPSDHREYGEAILQVLKQPEGASPHMDKLFEGIEGESPVSVALKSLSLLRKLT